MSDPRNNDVLKAIAVSAAVVFLYASVLAKLGIDWWADENYSHGLLVPFVIAFIVWREWPRISAAAARGPMLLGGIAVSLALVMLLAGTLGAELFSQRISLVLMLAGLVVYFAGIRVLNVLAVPFALLLLAIPIPQIVFNRIAMPLQSYASQMAVWGIRLFEVPTVRKGNVIDILPKGATQVLSLEVVEACSGIRSLMTLVTLALILAYFTRREDDGKFGGFSSHDLWRAVLLMLSAVPIAVVTNAARVTATGVATYYYGKQATGSTLHEASGWLVYVVALALLAGVNVLLRKLLSQRSLREDSAISALEDVSTQRPEGAGGVRGVWPVVAVLVASGIGINWIAQRSEVQVERRQLTELSSTLGEWKQRGSDIKFDPGIESVLRATDYTMREYTDPTGRVANIYVGYYATQRTGATYHSPQNCLPGAGWQLKEPQTIDITDSTGRTFQANLYIIENGIYREAMIYWYQGRGRTEASEYRDKLNTVFDSVTRRRTDGAMVRVMTSVGDDQAASLKAAQDLSSSLARELGPFIPE
jgi:exosortase D (VPLPA-CTERM-specific)